MTIHGSIANMAGRWAEVAAEQTVALLGSIISPRVVRLIEQDNAIDTFAVETEGGRNVELPRVELRNGALLGEGLAAVCRGSRLEIFLRSARFMFRSLEMPARASEFLDGIVRAQIDRLTPWSPNEAVFGYGNVRRMDDGRLNLVVAAAPRSAATPYIDAATMLRPASVCIRIVLA